MFLIIQVLLLSSCGFGNKDNQTIDPYYISGTAENKETLRSLFLLLDKEIPGTEEYLAVIREISNNYVRQKEYPKLVNLLTSQVNRNPKDPYNTYYLYMIAIAYMQEEAYPASALYFNLIIKNYPDLTISGESIHLACLNHLKTIVNNPEQRVWYYEELISRFSGQIDLAVAYFSLAQAYEQIGEWANAMQAYNQFLPFVDANVPGFPDAYTYAKNLVDFNNSQKNWTFDSLNSLVTALKNALDAGSYTRVEQYRAKVNFFARSWEQEATDDAGMAEFNLADFMRVSRIHYAASLDAGSNANEAYLRTWGWSQYISVWYLYFRKIDFPADPEIHGRWEWAGIYYGEKF
ncbi:MAG: tetratricopeptide repeat protein [Treponema sp.]|nr:tetratricopeptide repeat protein [Treponema sp.]